MSVAHEDSSPVAPHSGVEVAAAMGLGQVTVDRLLRGRVTLLQPLRGFRSSLDPLLLAAFVGPRAGRFVDIGSGTGALAFVLAAVDDLASGVAIEIQGRLAALATAGLAFNAFEDRIEVINADIRGAVGRAPLTPGSFDLVATNPPYRVVSAGVLSPDPEKAQANAEVSLTIDEWLEAAATLVNAAGRVAAVFPADRSEELLAGLHRRGLGPARLRFVRPREDRPMSRVLVEARPGHHPTALVREPPLVLHEPAGEFTAEAREMLGDSPSAVAGW